MYLFGCSNNFFKKETNEGFILFFIVYLGVQLIIIYKQKIDGPRWFIPYEWRKNPNAYNYIFKFSDQSSARRPNDPERANY